MILNLLIDILNHLLKRNLGSVMNRLNSIMMSLFMTMPTLMNKLPHEHYYDKIRKLGKPVDHFV